MREITLKINDAGAYKLYIDGREIEDATSVDINYSVDHITPDITIKYAMYNKDDFISENLDAYESGVIETILNHELLEAVNDKFNTEIIERSDQSDRKEETK